MNSASNDGRLQQSRCSGYLAHLVVHARSLISGFLFLTSSDA
jgi:peptide deformylase